MSERHSDADANHDALAFANSIIATVREPLVILDEHLRVHQANRSFYGTFRVSPPETEGRLIYELGNGQWDIPRLRTLLEDILPGQSAFEEFEVKHDFDRIGPKTMLLNARRVERPDTSEELILLAIEDVTERADAARKLTEYERRFRLIFESVKDFSVFTADPGGRITSWNAGAENVFGYREDEVIGRPVDLIYTPEDRAEGVPRRELEDAERTGRGTDERWHLKKDGSRFFASGIVTPLLDEDGRRLGFTKICRDITARKLAEDELVDARRRLEAALDAGAIYTWQWDLLGDRFFADGKLARLFSVSPDIADGGPVSAYIRSIHPNDRDRVMAVIDGAIASGDGYEVDCRIVQPNGSVRHISARGTIVRDPAGRAVQISGAVVDITDLKLAQAGNRLLAAIVASSNDAIYSRDLDGRITSWNAAAERIFGYTAGEIVGRPIDVLVPEGLAEEEAGIMERIRRGEQIEHLDTVRRTKDGRIIDVSIAFSPVRDDAGDVVGASKVARDVTDQKRTERSMRESEALKGAILASAMDCIITIDAGGRVLEWNPAAEATFGYPRSVAIGKAVADLIIPPELRQRHREGLARYFETGEGPVLGSRVEVPGLRSDGSAFPVELSIVPIRLDETTVFTAYARDITVRKAAEEDLRKSEERFRQLADAMPQIVWAARPDGFVDYYNQRWHEYVGMPAEAGGVAGPEAVAPPEDVPRIRDLWGQSLRTGRPYEIEYRLRRGSDGSFRWHLGRALAIRDDDGAIVRWIGTDTDIDDKKRSEETLAAARAEAEAANRMKDEFLATLSHELRTPLNAILGWSRILRTGKVGDDDRQEGLAAIERNAVAQAQIIEDLLDISRIISGNFKLEVQRVDLREIIETAIGAVLPTATAKGIRIHKLLDSLAGPVSGDPGRLQQVVWNLLSNAVKFTPGGGKVQVLLERVNSHVEISIIDTGMGIAPGFLPHVFDRFRQADSTTTRRHGGLGLGLAIVKQLVELHGGTVRAKSPGEGQGATFVVTLPIMVVHPEQVDAGKARPKQQETNDELCEDGVLAGVRVLVVDDEPDARLLIQRVLEGCEAKVAVASTAAEALAAIEGFRPDVLISDIGMPDQDGYDLIRQVRAQRDFRQLPAAALTAFARAEDRRQAMLAGFQTHVAKPVDPAELVAVVASLAGRTGTA